MAVFTAATAIGSTVVGTVAGLAPAVAAFTFPVLSAAVGFLTQAAVGLALNALAPKPSSESKAGIGGYRLNGKRSNLDHQVIYGETRVGGAIVFEESSGNVAAVLHRVIVHAGHPIDGYGDVTIDGNVVSSWKVVDTGQVISSPSEVPNGTELTPNGGRYDALGPFLSQVGGTIKLRFYDGNQTTADSILVGENVGWTNNHILTNCAYVICKFAHGDGSAFPSGIPETLFNIKGKEVYDPRTGTTSWSDNPALCIRDYLTSRYGLNEDSSNIDDALVSTAANVCDETNTVSGAKRFTCNGAFTTAVTPIDLLGEMLTSMGGLLWYAQGKWRMKPAYYTAPTVDFDEDDLRSSIALKTRHSRRDNFNIVKGTFKGPESEFEPTDYPELRNQAFIDADGGQESVVDLNLPFTDTADEARRIARIFLERNRQQLTVSASFGVRAFQVQVGDIIRLSVDRFGWSQKEFEVSSWTFGLADGLDLQVQMTLREISASVFDEVDDGVVYERDNTDLPNPFLDSPPQNLTVSDGGYTTDDGTFINAFIVDWDAPAARYVDRYLLEWRVQGDSKFNSVSLSTTEYQIAPVLEDVTYDIRVKAINSFGVSSPYATTTAQVGGDVTAPGLPTNISATGSFKYITIEWDNPPDADLNYVEVWENTSNTTSGATLVGESSGNQFVRTNLGLDVTRYYFLRSVDYSGNTSSYTTGVSGTTTFLDDPDFENGIRTLFEEQGLYPIEDVSSLPPSGSTGQKVFNRSDGKLYEWNGSSWVLVIASAETDDLIGQITETQISDDAISTPKLQAGAVTATTIAGSTITGDKIVANTITGGLLATSGIITNSAQIEDALITNAKIQNLAVDTAKIQNGAITNAKIDNAAITTAKIGDLQVDSAKIANLTVGTEKITGNAVTTGGASTGSDISFGGVSGATVVVWASFEETSGTASPTATIQLNGLSLRSLTLQAGAITSFMASGTASSGTNTVSATTTTGSSACISLAAIQLKR